MPFLPDTAETIVFPASSEFVYGAFIQAAVSETFRGTMLRAPYQDSHKEAALDSYRDAQSLFSESVACSGDDAALHRTNLNWVTWRSCSALAFNACPNNVWTAEIVTKRGPWTSSTPRPLLASGF